MTKEAGTVLNLRRDVMDSMYVLVDNKLMKLDNSRLKAEETKRLNAAKKSQRDVMAELTKAKNEMLGPGD